MLEPISKLLEQDAEGCKLHEAEEIGRIVFPPSQKSTLPLKPCKEALDDLSALVPTQSETVLRLALLVGTMGRDHLSTLLTHARIELIAVVRFIADQVLRLRFDHVEVEGQLHERNLMMVRGVRGDRQGQAVAIDNRHDFHAFSASRRSDLIATALCRSKRSVDIALRLIDTNVARRKLGWDWPQVDAALLVVSALLGPARPLTPTSTSML